MFPGQLREQFLAAHVGKDLAQLGREILPVVEQLRRHDADRIAVDRPRKRDAVAVDDVGARRDEGGRARPVSGRGIEKRESEESDRHEAKGRSEEHTSELQSLMRISSAVFCLTKQNKK